MRVKKLVLFDGNSLASRAFYALPLLNNDKGVYTNAVYGFAMMVTNVIEKEQPTHVMVAFDAGKTTFRHSQYKEYKGGRSKTPSELSEQFPFIKELLDAYHVKHYQLANYEADDIIGTLATQAEKEGIDEILIITGDRDLTQLASEKITVNITKKGITDVEVNTPETLLEKFNLTPNQIIDLKGLMGDSSDNIPGVKGVGEKTALKLLHEYGSVEKVLENTEAVSGKKLKENLTTYKEDALLSKTLATIDVSSPIEVTLDDTAYNGYEASDVIPIYRELGFKTLLEKELGEEPSAQAEPLAEIAVEIVKDIPTAELMDGASVYVEAKTDNYLGSDILGWSVYTNEKIYYLTHEAVLEAKNLQAFLTDETLTKRVYDAKRCVAILLREGIHLKGITFDLMLASYLLDPSFTITDFAGVAELHSYSAVENDETIYGKGAKWALPEEQILADHLGRKALAIAELEEAITISLNNNEQADLLIELELPLSLVLAEMEVQGVSIDTAALEKMKTDLQVRLDTLVADIHAAAGTEFNVNSPKQLGVILFEELQLPVIKKTKTGYSTSVDVLEQLQSEHPIIDLVMTYRQLVKLQSTYIEGLLKVTDEKTHKVHTRFNQTLTQTGRLSSVDPNLQNIPVRLEEGRRIRSVFKASQEGWKIYAADYSQIELRVLAHIAKDENLIAAFNADMDIHTKTAMDVFHVEADEVTSNMRRQAKAVNFGIVYGISDYGLSQNLGITRAEAQTFIDRYFTSYPKVKTFMEEVVVQTRQSGYVETILHRRRYIPEITSRNFNIRGFAERTAMNTPIQGSAADIIKQAMVLLDKELKATNIQATMLLQVHDELIFEVAEKDIERLDTLVKDVMANAVELDVPLKADSAYGDSWYDAK